MNRINATFMNVPRKEYDRHVYQILGDLDPAAFMRNLGNTFHQHIRVGLCPDQKYRILDQQLHPISEPSSFQIFDFVDWFAGSPIRYIEVYNRNWSKDCYTITYA